MFGIVEMKYNVQLRYIILGTYLIGSILTVAKSTWTS
jgi:hypothetical protein